jgi:LemA protein
MGTVLLIVIVVILVILVIYAIATYNGLVRRRNEVEESYRQIDVQLKRRYDLIPNLLEGVKKYFRQEQDVLTQITQARSQAMQPQSPGQQAQSEARLSGAIGNLFAVAENYPELRSNTVLIDFQEELSSTENKISFARQHYNDSVQSYKLSRGHFLTCYGLHREGILRGPGSRAGVRDGLLRLGPWISGTRAPSGSASPVTGATACCS